MGNHVSFAGSPLGASRMRVEAEETCDSTVGSIAQNGPSWAAWGAFSGQSHTGKAALIRNRYSWLGQSYSPLLLLGLISTNVTAHSIVGVSQSGYGSDLVFGIYSVSGI